MVNLRVTVSGYALRLVNDLDPELARAGRSGNIQSLPGGLQAVVSSSSQQPSFTIRACAALVALAFLVGLVPSVPAEDGAADGIGVWRISGDIEGDGSAPPTFAIPMPAVALALDARPQADDTSNTPAPSLAQPHLAHILDVAPKRPPPVFL